MQEQTLAMIMPWPLSWAPTGWHICDGTILQITQNTALYSLLGNMYGGDGQKTFALPDLRSRVQIGVDIAGKSGNVYLEGKAGGTETVTLTTNEIPGHNHPGQATKQSLTGLAWIPVSTSAATSPGATSPNAVLSQSNTPAVDPGTGNPYAIDNYVSSNAIGSTVYSSAAVSCSINATGATVALGNTGSGGPHANIQPCLAMNFIIAVAGNYPQRPD